MVKIKIPLPDDNLAGAEAEWIWAEPADNGIYVVGNIPFYAKGISCEDKIKATPQGDILVFDAVSQHSGHSTYRVYAKDWRTAAGVAPLLETLRGMRCDIEIATDNLVGVDVLPEADIYEVYGTLEDADRAGIIDFDEGHCGHSLKG